MGKGILVVSLDFELAWGFHYSNRAKGPYQQNILGARTVIPKMLKLFEKYGIHATWATVGALGCRSKTELIELLNKNLVYIEKGHSMAAYIEQNVGKDEDSDPLHYADSLIRMIRGCPDQWIGSHTFSHFFLFEKTFSEDDFARDIASFKSLFPEAVTNIFPRNQISDAAVTTLWKQGFKAYRGVPENKAWIQIYRESRKNPLVIRVLRLIDTYLPLSGYYDYPIEEIKAKDLYNIRASSFLRPFDPRFYWMETLKIRRIKAGMRRAAIRGNVFHLCWHPHCLGIRQEVNLGQLEEIFRYFKLLNEQYGMASMSMEEVSEHYERCRKSTPCL